MESKKLELPTIPGLFTDTAQLRQALCVARKEIESRGTKLLSLKEIGDENYLDREGISKVTVVCDAFGRTPSWKGCANASAEG